MIGERVAVIAGTGTRRPELEHVEVLASSSGGRGLRLTKDTYFYKTNLLIVQSSELRRGQGVCGRAVFDALDDLVRQELLTASEGEAHDGEE